MFTLEVRVDALVSAILQLDAFSHLPAVMDHLREPQSDKGLGPDVCVVSAYPSLFTYFTFHRETQDKLASVLQEWQQ